MAYKFGVSDILAAMGMSGASAVQDYASDQNIEFASVQDQFGNVISGTEVGFNNKYERTVTVKTDGTNTTASFKLGGAGHATAGLVITSASIRYVFNDYPSIAVTAHVHTGNENTHLESVASGDGQNEWNIADVPLGFGVPEVYLLGSGLTAADCQSCELNFACDHVDKQNNAGMFLVGTSHNPRCECSEEYVSDTTGITPTASGWKITKYGTRQVNNDFYIYSVSAFRHDVESVIS